MGISQKKEKSNNEYEKIHRATSMDDALYTKHGREVFDDEHDSECKCSDCEEVRIRYEIN